MTLDIQEYDLKEPCRNCFGRGEIREVPCVTCDGYGFHLTANGKVLLNFLQNLGIGIPMSPLAEDKLRGMVE